MNNQSASYIFGNNLRKIYKMSHIQRAKYNSYKRETFVTEIIMA